MFLKNYILAASCCSVLLKRCKEFIVVSRTALVWPFNQGQVGPDSTAPGITQAYRPLHHCKVGIFGDWMRSLVIHEELRVKPLLLCIKSSQWGSHWLLLMCLARDASWASQRWDVLSRLRIRWRDCDSQMGWENLAIHQKRWRRWSGGRRLGRLSAILKCAFSRRLLYFWSRGVFRNTKECHN